MTSLDAAHAASTAPAARPVRALAPRRRRLVAPVATIGGLALTTWALHLRDPHVHGSWGFCPLASMGIYCPGCGGLRAVNDLTHADVVGAASSNLAFVVALPFLVVALGLWLSARWRGVPLRASGRLLLPAGWSVLALLAAFTVLRNVPGSWLAP